MSEQELNKVEKLRKIKLYLNDLESYFGTSWTSEREELHAQVLLSYSMDQIDYAILACKQDPEIKFMPMGSLIADKCREYKERKYQETKIKQETEPVEPTRLRDILSALAIGEQPKFKRPQCKMCDDFGYITMLRKAHNSRYEYNYRCVCKYGAEYEEEYQIIDPMLDSKEWEKYERKITYED